MSRSHSGDHLFDVVSQYAALGDHRTGTAIDRATAEWMSDLLRDAGLDIEPELVEFEQWTFNSRLTVNGDDLEHLPLFYSWTGAIETGAVDVQLIDPMSGGFPGAADPHIERAKGTGAAAAVLATEHPNGSLVAINRDLDASRPDFPTVLAAGRDHAALAGGHVALTLEATLGRGVTTNIVARNGVGGSPLMLTTPLNGWFGCAGERGTGIAVLLALVERFADRPLVVVATGGHELTYFGAHRWAAGRSLTPSAIVHVGASVAVESASEAGDRTLIPTRLAMTSLAADDATPLAAALEPAELALHADTTSWIGEGEAFHQVGVPLLSFTGAGVDFHTPEDTPERATSPAALDRVARAIGDAADELHRHSQSA